MIGLIAITVLYFNIHNVSDWWKLRNYTPTPEIAAIATDTAMTDYGRRLFYVNNPKLLSAETFSDKCDLTAEKTIILGCYLSADRGIYVYDVRDERLKGVIEVTAAHEMLHAGYARLSAPERSSIDKQLQSFYDNVLSEDEHIRETLNAYREADARTLHNEMHSIFATEVRELPKGLENYYSRYFTARTKTVQLSENYQQEFTSRRTQSDNYNTQLESLKPRIENGQRELDVRQRELDQLNRELDRANRQSRLDEYNQLVDQYNREVVQYNNSLENTKALIAEYNDIVEKMNALALEFKSLNDALSGVDSI